MRGARAYIRRWGDDSWTIVVDRAGENGNRRQSSVVVCGSRDDAERARRAVLAGRLPAGEDGGYDAHAFARLAAVEERSFWFRSRNRLIVSTLGRFFPRVESLLEVGCGTGFVLAAITSAFPHLRLAGTELFPEGLEVARRRLGEDVVLVREDARELRYREEFDVVGAFDVLEHVEEDTVVLERIREAVGPGGGLVLTVPQHPRLWSATDAFAHHVRRYTRRGLERKVHAAGFDVVHRTSFVTALLPPMVAARAARSLSRRPFDPVADLEPGRLNALFERVLDAERRLIERGVSLPVGGSLLLVARARSSRAALSPTGAESARRSTELLAAGSPWRDEAASNVTFEPDQSAPRPRSLSL